MDKGQTGTSQTLTQVMHSAAQPRHTLPKNILANDARYFKILARTKSLRRAAVTAKCSLNTMRSHIARLEDQVGSPLFRRSPSGAVLTELGKQLLDEIAQQTSDETIELVATRIEQHNELRLAVTEGLGAFWLVPRLIEFQKQHPDTMIALDCKMSVEDFGDHNSDIAVQLERPTDPRLMCVKLGTLHLMPFASLEYLREHGTPTSFEHGFEHRLVVQIADQVRSEVLGALAGEDAPRRLVRMSTNTSSAHYWAIARGAGIGVLPTYARAITKRIVPIDMELKLRRDIWLIYHRDVKRSKIGQKAIEFMKQSFDPVRYPWFSEQFVHPNDFETQFQGTNVVRLFAGFMDASDDECGGAAA